MKTPLTLNVKHPLPDFLKGRITAIIYSTWLSRKAESLLNLDKKRGKPYAANADQSSYSDKIHQAVLKCGERDPYTGDVLAWELIGTWDTSHKQPEGYERKFALMPTVDHITSDVLEFEICSWQSNKCKSDLKPEELVAFCKKVVEYRAKKQ
jgi:hypothetical protein